jgi:hypothetical protein
MAAEFADTSEVRSFIRRWRKIMMQAGQRQGMRAMSVNQFDRDGLTDLLEGAVELADLLIERYPNRAGNVTRNREMLRDRLARHK